MARLIKRDAHDCLRPGQEDAAFRSRISVDQLVAVQDRRPVGQTPSSKLDSGWSILVGQIGMMVGLVMNGR